MSEQNSACSVCLQSEHTCDGQTDTCLCVPLIKFCSICKNDSDKRACVSCIQTLLQRLTRQHSNEQQQQQQQQHANDDEILDSFNIYQNTLDGCQNAIAEIIHNTDQMEHFFALQNHLQTLERITIKALLYHEYCSALKYAVVATGLDAKYYCSSMLIRFLVAQSFFSETSFVDLLRHLPKQEAEISTQVPLQKICLLTKLNQTDSCSLLAVPTLQYQQIFDRVQSDICVEQVDEDELFAADVQEFVDCRIENAISVTRYNRGIDENVDFETILQMQRQLHSNSPPRNEQQQQQLEQQQQQQHHNGNSNNNVMSPNNPPTTKNQISCPMCRTYCTVLTYQQSKAEREALQPEQKTKTGKDSKPLLLGWDLRRCQRELLFLFDRQEPKKLCRCCTGSVERLVSGGVSHIYRQFRLHSFALSSILLFCFLSMDNVLFVLLMTPLLHAFFVAVSYFFTMRQYYPNVWVDGQVLLHCANRVHHHVTDVFHTATAPGFFMPNARNGVTLENINRVLNDSQTESVKSPLHMVINVEHKTVLGLVIDFGLQFLYANDTVVNSTSAFTNMVTSICQQCFIIVPFFLVLFNGIYRARRVEVLFEKFRDLLVWLKSSGDTCRFRLRLRGVSFAEKIVNLVRQPQTSTPAANGGYDGFSIGPWQFANTTEKDRFNAVYEKEADATPNSAKNVLFERIANNKTNDNILVEAALREQQKPIGNLYFVTYLRELFRSLSCKFIVWWAYIVLNLNSFDSVADDDETFTNDFIDMHLVEQNSTWLANALTVKLIVVLLCSFLTGNATMIQHFVFVCTALIRLELLLLIIKILIVANWKNMWIHSNLVNNFQAHQVAAYKTKEIICNAIEKSSNRNSLSSAAVKIDAIACE